MRFLPIIAGLWLAMANAFGQGVAVRTWTNSATLYVDATNGNDATAVRGVAALPWKTIYDVYNSSLGINTGAVASARSRDTISLAPGTYFCGGIPLQTKNLNLIAPNGGVTIIRKDFTNAAFGVGLFPLAANLISCGPLIMPGDNSTINLNGISVIATNQSVGTVYDAVIGWSDSLDTGQETSLYGFTNRIATNVTVLGGYLTGASDVVYCVQTNTIQSSVTMRSTVMRSGWDFMRLNSNVVFTTFSLDGFATNTASVPASENSRGVVIDQGVIWKDSGSRIGSGGGTVQNRAIDVSTGASAALSATVLYNTGSGGVAIFNATTNVTGFWIANGVSTGNGASLTNLPVPVSSIPALFSESYGLGYLLQREWPNAAAIGTEGMVSAPTLVGTATSFVPASGLPLGVQLVQAAGGISGINLSSPKEFWSTNQFTACWIVSYLTDVSSNRLWCSVSSSATASFARPQTAIGFRYDASVLDTHWIAYSNDTTTTNQVDTGVSVAINTLYTLVLRQVGTTNFYYINGTAVATNVWNPSAVGVRHNTADNGLNSQNCGLVIHAYSNRYKP